MKTRPRRFAALLLALLLSLPALATRAQESVPLKVELDGKALVTDVPPTIIDGRVMVPLRSIFEALDAVVGWDPETRRIVAIRGGVRVELTVGSTRRW